METVVMDEIPASEEPVQITGQILLQDDPTRVLEPEIQENHVLHQEPVVTQFDITKLSYELQQGYRIYVELLSDSNRNVTWPFLEPVDADSLGLLDYYERIKEPMCFATIGSKFTDYKYTSITEVIADLRLILENCYRYNGPSHWVSKLGQKLEKILEQKLALLSRFLRDKVTLVATMSLNHDLPLVAELEASGRRRSSRQNYLNMVNGENSSSLVNHVKIQEESEEKERRKQREKEKKEANQALLQDLVEWEEKELTTETINQLHSMWEIPSTGSFLYLVRNILGLEDINLTEFELSFIYPNKSSLLARIFTALLVTPHQRKSIYKRPVMTFKKWESKLKEKLDAWYKIAEKECLYAVSIQFGIDLRYFDILGKEKNPLEEKSFLDLTLYQRVWVLKTLCDVCFHKDYDIREKVNSCDFMEQRELFLGNDGDNHSYIYFPVFQTTDVRIYQHNPFLVPKLNRKTKKEPSPPTTPTPERKKSKKTPSRPPTPSRGARSSRLRQLRSDSTAEEKDEKEVPPDPVIEESNEPRPKPDPLLVFKVEDGFHLACYDIDSLKTLAEQFAEPPTPPKKRGRRPKPPPLRKRCEVDLHETLMALLQELEKYEGAFSRNYTKARIKIMKESLEPEAVEEPEEVPEPETVEEWGSEMSDDDDGAKLDAKDEDFRIEDEYGNPFPVDTKQPNLENEVQSISDESENGCSIAIQTLSPRHNRKRKSSKTSEDNIETQNSTNCTIGIQTPNSRIKKKKWSPTKEGVVINCKSVPSPSVVISAVSAQESVKAATAPQKVISIVKTLSTPTVGEKQPGLPPNIILVNALGEALKRAQSSKTIAPQVPAIDTTGADVEQDGSSQGTVAVSAVISKTSPTSSPASTLQAQTLRKRILVSPEGKAHEVKPCVVCKSTTTPAITASIHPPIQRKTAVQSVTSVKGMLSTAMATPGGIRATPITVPRTVAAVSQNKPTLATAGSAPSAGGITSVNISYQRPNILSHNRKQNAIPGKPGLATSTTGNPLQGRAVIPSPVTSHNHTYASSSALINQGSTAAPGQENPPPGVLMDKMKTASSIKMVQIIPSAKQTNIATCNSLYAVPAKSGALTISNPGIGINVLPKTVTAAGQTGVKVPSSKTSPSITTSNVLSHPKTIPGTTAQVSSSKTVQNLSKSVVIPRGGASVTAKAQAPHQTSKQTKVVFIPAASVDAKSPLANFKPQTLTTSNGQSIYGYAVVVPPGTPEEVNTVISSALRKPTSVSVKPLSISTQQKQQPMSASGKITDAATRAVAGKTLKPEHTNVKLEGTSTGVSSSSTSIQSRTDNLMASQKPKNTGITTVNVCSSASTSASLNRPRLSVASTRPNATSPQKPANTTVPASVSSNALIGSNTTQPRPGVATSPQKPANTTLPASDSSNALIGSTTTQPRPGVATSPQKPTNTTVPVSVSPSVSIGSNTTQPRPGVATSPQKPANTTVPVSVSPSVSIGSNTTQPRPGVSIGSSTTQPRPGDVQTTLASSTSLSLPASIPKATTVAISTKVNDCTSTNQRTDLQTTSALENGEKHRSDQKTFVDNSSISNIVEIKNQPSNNSNLPPPNNTEVTTSQIAKTVNLSAAQPSNKDPKETGIKYVLKESSHASVTSLPVAKEKLASSNKPIVSNGDQKTMTFCNGVSIHPTLKTIDSLQNIKRTENDTTRTDVGTANGIPDVKNS